jgi:Protein of unknown function (DUF3309)
MLTILLIILVIMMFGGLPTWGYHHMGYGPSGLLLVVVIVLVVLVARDRL